MYPPTRTNEQSPLQILVIDPEKEIITFLCLTLQSAGYQIEGCQHGQEGLEMAMRNQPELIILELILLDSNGLELCRQLRAEETLRELPILVLTYWNDDQVRRQAREVGVNAFMTKPFDLFELFEQIRLLTPRLNSGTSPFVVGYSKSWKNGPPHWLRVRRVPQPPFIPSHQRFDKCPYCGTALRPDDNFCLTCGHWMPSDVP